MVKEVKYKINGDHIKLRAAIQIYSKNNPKKEIYLTQNYLELVQILLADGNQD